MAERAISEHRGSSQGLLRRAWSTWVMTEPSRIEIARRRIRLVRYTAGVLAAAAFATFAVAARNAHPGTHAGSGSASTSGGTTAVTSSGEYNDDYNDDNESGDSFGFGSSSVSPSYGSTPSVQTGGS